MGASYAPLGTPAAGALFVAACVAWALLTLQDGVLTGLRKAEWVPAGNAVFSVGKLVLLIVFATALPVLGIFVSWAVAIAFSTLPLGWLIFRRLIPRQAAADRDLEPPKVREMGRFLAGDSLGALFSLAMINLLPVMVAVNFTAAENGYFYVAYTVGGTMEFMAINMASSLTAHASHDPRRLADGVRGALRRMTLLLVPVVLVLVLFAPYILAPSTRTTPSTAPRCCGCWPSARCRASSWSCTSACCGCRAAPACSPRSRVRCACSSWAARLCSSPRRASRARAGRCCWA